MSPTRSTPISRPSTTSNSLTRHISALKTLFEHGAISQAMVEAGRGLPRTTRRPISTAAEEQLKTLRRGQGPPQQHCQCVRAYLRRGHRAKRDERGCRRRYALGLVPRPLPSPICPPSGSSAMSTKTTSPNCNSARQATDQHQCLSGSSRSTAASATSARCSIHPCARPRCASRLPIPAFSSLACLSPRHSPAGRNPRSPWFPLTPCFICTIATGSSCRPARNQFKRTEVQAGKMLEGNRQADSLRHLDRASRSSPTHCCLKPQGTSR